MDTRGLLGTLFHGSVHAERYICYRPCCPLACLTSTCLDRPSRRWAAALSPYVILYDMIKILCVLFISFGTHTHPPLPQKTPAGIQKKIVDLIWRSDVTSLTIGKWSNLFFYYTLLELTLITGNQGNLWEAYFYRTLFIVLIRQVWNLAIQVWIISVGSRHGFRRKTYKESLTTFYTIVSNLQFLLTFLQGRSIRYY